MVPWYRGTLPTKVYALSTQKFFLELEKKLKKIVAIHLKNWPYPKNEEKNFPFPQFLTDRGAVQREL